MRIFIVVCTHPDFVYVDNVCLMVSQSRLGWFQAKAYCELLKGNLIVLDSEEKHNTVNNFLQRYCKYIDAFTFVSFCWQEFDNIYNVTW